MRMLKFPIYIFVLSSLLSSYISQVSPSEERCSGRKILTSINGSISDGWNNYTQYSRCEWLIDAGSSEKFILLEFSFMQTECSYDFVMVYDGNSFNSTLLATVSGDTNPRLIVAKSGYMLIYLFSDRNYNLKGFIANYSIQDCPNLCYNRGKCVNHICVCDTGFTGEACESHICPDSCHSHGQCDLNGCHCDKRYIGDSCNFTVDGDRYDNRWYNLSHSSQNFTARFGHSGSYIKNVNCIYVYGGFNLNHVLDDIVIYCLDNSTWDIAIKTNPWPLGRKNHATATVANGFFILGGVLVDGSFSNDLWFYNVSSRIWTEKAKNSSVRPERMMDHTLTFADGWLYLIGGKTEQGLFSSNIYRIDIKECETWEKLRVSGDSRHSRMLSAHTAVFHSVVNTIIIYGGYQSSYSKYVELSDKIYAFSIRFHVWSEINNRQVEKQRYDRIHNHVPGKRAHHTSVIIGNYMVVYGGNIHIHEDIETCYDNGTYLYHFGCHQWVTHPLFLEMSTPTERRFGHVAVSAYGNTMFVVGGYSGSVLGDVAAFKFPPTIAPPESELLVDKDYCRVYTDSGGSGAQSCIDDVECALCTQKDTTSCVHRETCDVSKGNVATTPCPGICSLLTSCEACLSHGQEVTMTTTSAKTRVYQEECSWCVKNASCQNRWDPDGLCDGTSVKGWWEGTSQSWTSIDQCTNNDIRAGIQMIYYYPPQNLLQPDQVLYLASSDIRVEDILPFHGNIKKIGKQIIVRITGYIHPLNARLVQGTSDLQLYLKGSGDLKATLNLSTDSSVKNQEIVIREFSYKMESGSQKANRISKMSTFPNRDRGYKYYMAIEAGKILKKSQGSLILEWNIDVEEDDDSMEQSLHSITIAFLEPYNSVHCTMHSNCLACMTDASCAWCSSSLECLYKGDNSTNCIEMYAVTQPNQCDLCHNYPDCVSCVSSQICEWSPDEEICIRRGRYHLTSHLISECPLPCYKRNNCSICVEELKDECFWCENTQECFPFAHYISHHISGQCQEWVDSYDLNKKHTCRDCSIFKSCDDCLSRYGCGWCGNIDNRMIGKCVDGDFSGPAHNLNCSVIVAKEGKNKNITVDGPAVWMYEKCLALDECARGVHNCHKNASCENTEMSYICKCNKGFIQVGNDCYKTCYHHCVHGKCNATTYECDCDLGYTGPDCSTDCQCNHQSMCSRGIGICDACQENTGGSNCQYCLPGYYGNPSEGCMSCQCNNHEEMTRGHCNNVTGECYCTDNTEGEHCKHCQYGYYGDPSNGGKCYRNCDNRVVINQTMGSLGSFKGSGITDTHIHCLWIISEGDIHNIENEGVYDTTTVTFTIDDIATECGKEHVYVYEGIPSFVYGTTPNKDTGLLASFCGTKSPVSVTARSKTITVYFEMEVNDHPIMKLFRDFTHQAALAGKTFWIDSIEAVIPGFNGSYEVNNCGDSCSFLPNRVCKGQKCVCDADYTGDNCQDFICADRCVFHKNNQTCQCETTLGPVGILPWSSIFWPKGGLQEQVSRSRYGHTLVYCGSDSLYMFGGYSLRHGLLNDMWKYNMTTSMWTVIVAVTTTEPKGRYYHTAVCLPYLQNIYVFGGFIQEKGDFVKATNEMWKFGIGTRKWTLEVPPEVNAVAGHTMTKIGDTKLLVIGGFSRKNYFSEWMYEYDAANSSWKKYDQHTDLIGAPVGIYGHTAVYHELTETVYIYGGMLLKHDNPVVSDELFAFDLNDKQWNNLQSDEGSQKDKRIFHTAVDVGEYIVIFGGQFTEHDHIRDHVLIYHYQCNFWNQFKFLDTQTQKSINVMVSAASVAIGTTVYIIGGYNGQDYSEMIKLSLPEDRCHLIKDVTCKNSSGCKVIVVPVTDEKNITSCFSSDRTPPDEAVQIVGGPQCDEQWHQTRHCEQYTDCGSCLAVFPQFNKSRPTCQWCSNCLESKCIKFGLTCPDNDNCNPDETSTKFRVEHCPDFTCRAGTCERCNKLGKCAWGRPFMTELENGGTKKETLGWSCIDRLACINNSCSYSQCPSPCHTAVNCLSCLFKSSTISGSMECTWSNKLQQCMSPEHKNLCCSTGNCGLLIDSFENHCPKPCHEFSRCSECLMTPQCGWCAYGGQNGLGLCIPGGIKGPTVGKCEVGDIRNSETDIMNQYHHYETAEPTWSYIDCPPENECLNDHHNCNLRTQKCVDTQEGYDCFCKPGYREDTGEKKCIPVCQQGCFHGTCVLPDVCRCDFGYVGTNCMVECECHKHSNCESVDKKKNCSLCHNNTQGDQCEHCKLWYVGNPKKEEPCVPCFNVCHNHTTRCSSVKDFARLDPAVTYTTYDYEKVIPNFNPNGPNGKPVCIRCQNNTEGRLCDVCQNGFFRLKSGGKTAYDACIKCQCHGHSNTCDNTTGKCHYCANNTETRCNSDDKGSPDKCWKKQCSSCKEYFQGNPVNNHQCYRQMTLEKEYCLDPSTQNDCNQNPGPLMQGRTVFYAVHPRYLNVDIRITIDVLKGGADVFFSSSEKTFTVKVNKDNGVHILELDDDLHIKSGSSQKWSYPMNKRSLDNYNIHIHNIMTDLAEARALDKRSVQNSSSGVVYELVEINAENFHTYHTVTKTKTILRVKNVESRLVITIPVHSHNLRLAKFYIIMYGVGGQNSNHTFGNLYFRQDQPHIDLFVFFSVFFSSFFLFLAVCVLLWKMKQAVDTQRSRQQRAKEMMHMASRPFSKVLVYIEPEPIIMSSTPILRRQKLPKLSHRNVPIMGLPPVEILPPIIHTLTTKEIVPFDVTPIAMEPIINGSAVIRTVVIQLPGGPHATSKLCLGSTLTTNYRAAHNSLKSNTRRRPSTTAC